MGLFNIKHAPVHCTCICHVLVTGTVFFRTRQNWNFGSSLTGSDGVLVLNIHNSPMEGIFSKTPHPTPPLWKFQLSFIRFFKFFGLTEPSTPPPPPQEIPIPSVGRVWMFSRTVHSYNRLQSLLVLVKALHVNHYILFAFFLCCSHFGRTPHKTSWEKT